MVFSCYYWWYFHAIGLWDITTDELQSFLEFRIQFHNTIKFTSGHSTTSSVSWTSLLRLITARSPLIYSPNQQTNNCISFVVAVTHVTAHKVFLTHKSSVSAVYVRMMVSLRKDSNELTHHLTKRGYKKRYMSEKPRRKYLTYHAKTLLNTRLKTLLSNALHLSLRIILIIFPLLQ